MRKAFACSRSKGDWPFPQDIWRFETLDVPLQHKARHASPGGWRGLEGMMTLSSLGQHRM